TVEGRAEPGARAAPVFVFSPFLSPLSVYIVVTPPFTTFLFPLLLPFCDFFASSTSPLSSNDADPFCSTPSLVVWPNRIQREGNLRASRA
ncbi:hypothetical protein FA10DRAFT_247054, partial [Acaromyces ingoldii]